MKIKNIARIGLLLSLAFFVLAFAADKRVQPVPVAYAEGTSSGSSHCRSVGGTVMTNLGVVNQSTTLGVATGDLQGAVSATILNIASGPNGTTIFSVQTIS